MDKERENKLRSTPQGKERKVTNARLFSHLSASFLAVLFVVGMSQFNLDGLNGFFVDAQFRLRFWPKPHPDIVLIAYDEMSSNRYYGSPKIPAVEIANVLDALEYEQPLAIAVIATLSDKNYSDYEMELVGESFSRLPQSLVGYIDDESFGKVHTNAALPNTKFLPAFISRDNFSYGADSVSRRAMITIGGLPTVYAELARLFHGQKEIPSFRHAHRYAETGPLQVYINWQGSAGTYPIYSSQDISKGNYPAGTFNKKIVLFGSALPSKKSTDFILTPYSRSSLDTTLLEGAAHTLATLLNNEAVFKSPPWFNWALSFLVALLTVNMVLLFSPVKGIVSVVGEVSLIFVVSWLALTFFHCWVDMAHPFIAACFGYYLVIPYRLVNEYRKRWHYQQKSEMMAQLEQLKSNFLSLVSHDLKTPLARIQGNAELLLNESNTGEKKETKVLSSIVDTTENMTKYVQTILDLTRIESSQIPLQKSSKDINATIKEVIDIKRIIAAEKEIMLETHLEPLFSFKFDTKLIRRVLSNLVENAIKYSPEGSKITLSSTEDGNWIRVSVADEGVGIPTEEQERVFTKFYRCENTATQHEKGTGLGLYLVKYFVELHRGFVELKSEAGKGSVFTVSLPV